MNMNKNYQIKVRKNNIILIKNFDQNIKKFVRLNNFCNFIEFNKKVSNLKSSFSNAYFKKKLLLKGLGYRALLENENRTVSFKLNLSHPVVFDLPNFITNIKTSKKLRKFSLKIFSSDKVLVGNFAQKIIALKPVDFYKGKGFRIKGTRIRLKPIKKK